MAFVVDASALTLALLEDSQVATALRRRLRDETCSAPHLLDAELGNALRRHVRQRRLDADEARIRLGLGLALVDHRHRLTDGLLDAAWALRDALSFYDATYVALAAALVVPFVTADARIARASRLPCEVELVGAEP